jgi:hypothetical protein
MTNGKLCFPPAILEEIKSAEKPFTSTFHLVDDFENVSGDNFTLQATLKNNYNEKWAVCQQTQVMSLGTKSSIILGLSIPGSVSEIGVMMSEVYLSGKKHDLSGLGADLSAYRNLKIEVVEKQLKAYLDEGLIFSEDYNESIGNIAGIRFRFLGAGEVAKVHLRDIQGKKVIIDEDFNP